MKILENEFKKNKKELKFLVNNIIKKFPFSRLLIDKDKFIDEEKNKIES